MTLQHFAAVTTPFVGKLAAFGLIAVWAGNNQIGRIVRPTFNQWYNMIYLVSAIEFLFAPITATFLPFVLMVNILWCIGSSNLHFSCASSSRSGTTNRSTALRYLVASEIYFNCIMVIAVILVEVAPSFLYMSAIGLSSQITDFIAVFKPSLSAVLALIGTSSFNISVILFALVCNVLVAIIYIVLSIVFLFVFFPVKIFAAYACSGVFADLAIGIKTVVSAFVASKIGSWLTVATMKANLCRGIHSVFLSLNSRCLPAGGGINRFLGATLADNVYYTAYLQVIP